MCSSDLDKWADKNVTKAEAEAGIREQLKSEGLLLSEEAVHHAIIFIELLIKHGAKS